MKRTVYVAAGVLALTTAIVITAQLRGQTGAAQRPATSTTAPTTKVAIVNLNRISQGYEKVKTFNEEVKRLAEPYVAEDKKLQDKYNDLVKKSQVPNISTTDRESIERDVKAIQRTAQDNKDNFQKIVGKKNEDQLKILFMDLHSVVTRIAQARGYELVLHYNDALKSDDYWSAQNIARKMQAGSLMPLYWVGGIDISEDVVATLNSSTKPATTGGGSTGGGH